MIGWAYDVGADLHGRARRDGIGDVGSLPAADMLGVIYSYMIDDATSGFRPRALARADIDAFIRGESPEYDIGEHPAIGEWGHTSQIEPTRPVERHRYPDRETWGLLPEHVAGLERAMTIVGGSG